jgi:hypothetical protein
MNDKRRSWREVLPIHPAAELFPRVTEQELRELGEDIRERGLVSPITVFKEVIGTDVAYSLLDGINRLDSMELAGIKFEFHRPKFGDLVIRSSELNLDPDVARCREVCGVNDDAYAFVLSINIRRRHLTAKQKRELVKKVVVATPEKSDRAIAEMAHVDHKTVAAIRAEKVATGEIPQLMKTVGKDGKERKPPKPRPTKSPVPICRVFEATIEQPAAQPPDEPNGPSQTDDPIDVLDCLTENVRSTVDLIGRKWPAKLEPLRKEIDQIFRVAIEGRAQIDTPTHLGKPQSCEPDEPDDLAIPAFPQRGRR